MALLLGAALTFGACARLGFSLDGDGATARESDTPAADGHQGESGTPAADGHQGESGTPAADGHLSGIGDAALRDGSHLSDGSGRTWSVAPMPAMASGNVGALWGSSASDVWAAVWGTPAALHYDGSSWKVGPSGLSHADAIWGTGPKSVWLALQDEIHFYDGAQWTVAFSDGGAHSFAGLWGSGPNDLWAVSGGGTPAYHFDGSHWSPSTLTNKWHRGVFGFSAKEVYAYGLGGEIYRFDGTSFTLSQKLAMATVHALWGSSPSDYWVGGEDTFYKGYLVHVVNGTAGPAIAVSDSVYGLWGFSASDVWAVGKNGTVRHFDGLNWAQIPWSSIAPSSGTMALWCVWGASPRDIWIGGESALVHGQ